jgi:hypothetical protein
MPARSRHYRTAPLLCLMAFVLVLAACGGGKGPSGTDQGSSSGEACTVQGDLTSDESWTGDAFVELTTDTTVDTPLTFNIYRADAPFLVEFEGDNGESLLICGGDPFTGSRDTSDTLGLRVDLGSTDAVTATSSSGECTVDMITMTLGSVEGDFDCSDLTDDNQPDVTFSVTGQFAAANPFGNGDSVVP